MADTIQEIPLTDAPEQPQSEEIPEAPPPPPLARAKSKATPKARGKRGPDKRPRAKPAPRAKAVVSPIVEPQIAESESEESVDEATMQELHALSMLRSIRSYDQDRRTRKQQLYASWFNR